METRDIFEQMAARYDTEERAQIAGRIATEIRECVADTAEKSALDYGCGTGLVGLHLTGLFASMLFVDTSPQMVAQVQKKLDDAHVANASVLCADFMEGVPSGLRADYVLLSQVLLHVKNYPVLLRRLYDLLSPGGHLIVVDFDRNENIVSEKVHPGFDQAALIRQAKETGFARAEAHTFYHGEKMFMNQDASLFLLDAVKA